jgi:hypothetical protein
MDTRTLATGSSKPPNRSARTASSSTAGVWVEVWSTMFARPTSTATTFNSAASRLAGYGTGNAGERYANKRAEMYGACRAWLRGGALPFDQDLRQQLLSITYTFNARDEIILTSKEVMMRDGKPSPDDVDALVLTFAHPRLRRAPLRRRGLRVPRRHPARRCWQPRLWRRLLARGRLRRPGLRRPIRSHRPGRCRISRVRLRPRDPPARRATSPRARQHRQARLAQGPARTRAQTDRRALRLGRQPPRRSPVRQRAPTRPAHSAASRPGRTAPAGPTQDRLLLAEDSVRPHVRFILFWGHGTAATCHENLPLLLVDPLARACRLHPPEAIQMAHHSQPVVPRVPDQPTHYRLYRYDCRAYFGLVG